MQGKARGGGSLAWMSWVRAWLLGWTTLAALGGAANGQTAGRGHSFREDFALAENRKATLEKLIPGSEDYYYYSCLERQHAEDHAAVSGLLAAWIDRHGRSARVEQIEFRSALLRFESDPAGTWRFLRERLGLRFDHQRETPGAKPDLPTELAGALVTGAAWRQRALQRHPGSVRGVRGAALEELCEARLDDAQLGSLLQSLARPDVAQLPDLIVRHLKLRTSGKFGALPIHRRLTLEQLERCAQLEPGLLAERDFVAVWLARLAPGADEDAARDPGVRRSHLERLEAFATRLSPAFNSLKAHVLYRRLELDLAAGKPDRERLKAYLKLPRRTSATHPRLLERGAEIAELGESFATGLPPVGGDESLVRAYLEHFLRDAADSREFAELVEPRYLARVFAEAKILAGVGDMERWYSLLDDPGYYEQLKQRVELRFAPTQPEWFAADAPVALELDVKNVPALLVKVYEIHALNFYAEEKREIDASIALDGLVANEELTFEYSESPLRRVRRRYELLRLARPGVYVVEFIGAGTASRAVVRKGGLSLVERVGSAGHVFRVTDDTGAWRRDAALHFEGRRFAADERGEIVLPFTSSPGNKPLIVEAGERVALARFEHQAEAYALHLGLFVEREALRSGQRAKLLLRPLLTIQEGGASLALLEDAVLTITSTNADGVVSSLEVRGPTLTGSKELVHEITVPERLVRLSATLRGSITSLSTGRKLELSAASEELTLNTLDATTHTDCPLLGRAAEGWFLDVLGRSGEPRADRAVALRIQHRDYLDPLEVTLKTDAQGRIRLGALEGVESLTAGGFPGGEASWRLDRERRTQAGRVHASVGAPIRIPYLGRATLATRSIVSLLELRGGVVFRDAFSSVALVDGYLELRDLAAGDYELVLEETNQLVSVSVTAGAEVDGWAVGRARALELGPATALHVRAAAVDRDALVVRLGGAGEGTRVHVFATRYLPAYDPFAALERSARRDPRQLELARPASDHRSGREIGDEFRYILERRFARKFPGNLLRRPGMLLNPWALEESDTALGLGGGAGGAFGGRSGGARSLKARGGSGREWSLPAAPAGVVPDLEFLSGATGCLVNLEPGADGVLRVALSELGAGRQAHVLVLDAGERVYTTVALADQPLRAVDRRLSSALDAERHLAERRGIEFVKAGDTLTLDERATVEMTVYDTLDDVFAYFRTQDSAGELARFAFLVRWPSLSPEEQRTLYSDHACHELHLFLQRKDPAFFEQVVRPYLANKFEKTFLDRWLLGESLERFLEPWAFAQLNVVERILLTRRLSRAANGERHVRELFELAPPDPTGDERRFATALARSALAEASESGGYRGPSDTAAPASPPAGAALARAAKGAEPAHDDKSKKDEAPQEELAEDLQEGDAPVLRDDESVDLGRRLRSQALYVPVASTRTFAETHYWRRRLAEHDAKLIAVNAFWRDFAAATPGQPFVSPNFVAAIGNVNEMLLALALLDLPFTAEEHAASSANGVRTLRASGPLLAVRKDLRDSPSAAAAAPLLVAQDFFRLDDRFEFVGGERRDKFVRDEFLAEVAYGGSVVVTNPTSSLRELELLLQIPAGAVPVSAGRRTRGQRVRLAPYGTQSVEYAFYFPRSGRFAHYPVHVSEKGELVAFAPPVSFTVVAEPTTVDAGSWEHISQRGSEEEVLRYLGRANLGRVDLGRIAWRMRDRRFFDQTLAVLRERLAFDPTIWSYALLQEDAAVAREYLRFEPQIEARVGAWLDSPLLRVDPVERRQFESLEFHPLVNSRAHSFGRGREILNPSFARHYERLLEILVHRPRLDDRDWIGVTCALVLQDRVEEALAAFAKVDPERLEARLQYDYLRAYLDFYDDRHALARGIAERYRDYPVSRWRNLFADVLSQLDEAGGAPPSAVDERDRDQRQGALAASEPALDIELEGRRVRLAHRNVERCEVSYYPMDVEFLFSTNPFVQQDARAHAFIRPRRTDVLTLPAGAEHVFDLPAEFDGANVLVEVRAGALVRRKPCLRGSLRVQWRPGFGQLAVTRAGSGEPLPKAYVKVYAREADGKVRFHKDGYTDLRGRFDYASLSGSSAESAARYAVLVLSEKEGAVIGEVDPPAR